MLFDVGDILTFLTGHSLYGSREGVYALAEYFLGRTAAESELRGIVPAVRQAVEIVHPELPTAYDFFSAASCDDIKGACLWWMGALGLEFALSPDLQGCIAYSPETMSYRLRWELAEPFALKRSGGLDVEMAN